MVSINPTNGTPRDTRLAGALSAGDPSVRLQAALAAGSNPGPALLEPLVERCAVEPDLFVRDMLSWALTRLPPETTLPRLRRELGSERAQARSQALHTLSKIGDERAWGWITHAMLRDPDDEVARTAWRVAVALAPEDEKKDLAGELAGQLGRGDREVRLSLSRALAGLGDVAETALATAAASPDPAVSAHARATQLLRRDPEIGFDAAVEEAKRVVALGPERAAAAGAGTGTGGGPGADGAGENADAGETVGLMGATEARGGREPTGPSQPTGLTEPVGSIQPVEPTQPVESIQPTGPTEPSVPSEAVRALRAARAEEAERSGRADNAERADNAGRAENTKKAENTERAEKAENARRVENTGWAENTGRAENPGRADNAGETAEC
ncbi:HEAT repeat domain-containing protein [Streptomyces sp. BBFR109]|uniref:HEAT repeat domain-containing protein n=1 Tax=Streptomyces sp. BBFR109 TaxID=3448172 RepID=UPI003F774E71